jgi:hypothetical protein
MYGPVQTGAERAPRLPAMISGSAIIAIVVQLVIVGLIFYVLWWALGKIGLPEPFNKICTVILVLLCALWLINLLLGLGGHPLMRWG